MNRIALTVLVLVPVLSGGLRAWDNGTLAGRFPSPVAPRQGDAGPDWLVRHLEPSGRIAVSLLPQEYRGYGPALNPTVRFSTTGMSDTGQSAGHARISGWQQAGIYGLEFGGAAVGTLVAARAAIAVGGAVPVGMYAAVPAYAISSALLSATGTHLVGKSLGQRGTFGHALAGGALGGISGAALVILSMTAPYSTSIRHDSRVLQVSVLALPALSAVVVYNVWRSNDPK